MFNIVRMTSNEKEGKLMTLRLNDRYLQKFIRPDEYTWIQGAVNTAHQALVEKSGAGSDFLGWTSLPDDYDREEFARIKAAAQKIRSSCDVFIVIGIGGSYLGASAVIEFWVASSTTYSTASFPTFIMPAAISAQLRCRSF